MGKQEQEDHEDMKSCMRTHKEKHFQSEQFVPATVNVTRSESHEHCTCMNDIKN